MIMAKKKFVEKQGPCLCCGNGIPVLVRLIRLNRVPVKRYEYEYQWLCPTCRVAPFYRGKFTYAKKEPKRHL